MFNIVPLFFIIISLGVIVVIVVRKYPELTLLDLDTIPDRKEKQKKKELLARKAGKRSKDQQAKLMSHLTPVQDAWKIFQTSFRRYVKKVKDEVAQSQQQPTSTGTPSSVSHREEHSNDSSEDMLKKGMRSMDDGKYQEAESTFIRVIENDSKCVAAYEGLGDVYDVQQQYDEAKETYLFAKKLDPHNVSVLIKLALLAEREQAWIEAIQYYEEALLVEDTNHSLFAKLAELFQKSGELQAAHEAIHQAVDLHPKNLLYLDNLAEISILMQDKNNAEEAVQAIRMIDPGYARLGMLKDRIAEL